MLNLYYNSHILGQYLSYGIQLGMTVVSCTTYMLILMILTLMQGHSWLANAKKSVLTYLNN